VKLIYNFWNNCYKDLRNSVYFSLAPVVLDVCKINSFIEYVKEVYKMDVLNFAEVVYRSVTSSEQFINLERFLNGRNIKKPRNNKRKKKIMRRDEKMEMHMKGEITFIEFLIQIKDSGKIVWQYPIPSSLQKEHAKITPDIIEFKRSEISTYENLDKDFTFPIPSSIYEVKCNGTRCRVKYDLPVKKGLVLVCRSRDFKSKRTERRVESLKKRFDEVWSVNIDYFDKLVENPRNVGKYVYRW
jgi:hypothetical protein